VRTLRLVLLLTFLVSPAFAVKPISVAELEQLLASSKNNSDRQLTHKLQDVELSERLSLPRLMRLSAGLPGTRSRRLLTALADASSFKASAADEIPADETPDLLTMRIFLTRAMASTRAAIGTMPNFLASRTTTRFHNFQRLFNSPESTQIIVLPYPVFFDDSSAGVRFSDGKEVISPDHAAQPLSHYGLAEWGVFGPLLGAVMSDLVNGEVHWAGWEQSNEGQKLATFRYSVEEAKSHFDVRYCCTTGYGFREFHAVPGYHGRIVLDPETGAIRRLVIQSELKPGPLIDRADIAVDYDPVEIGGRRYICPVRSVSITRAKQWAVNLRPFGGSGNTGTVVDNPKVTSINDTRFSDYHVFRSEMRITGFDIDTQPQPQ
jgi:hypothetical protein